MRHLSKTLATMALLVFLLVQAGCENRQEQKVVFAVGGAPAELAFWEEIVRDFVTATGARVELLRRPADTEQQRQGLIIALKAGMSDPDVFLMDVAWLGLFTASNWLAPLQQVDRSAFFAQVLKCLIYERRGCTNEGISAIEPLGRETLFHVDADSLDLLVLSSARPYAQGEEVRIRLDVERLHVFKRGE